MKLYPIPTGNFKLDGGAMFGVVPKSIWNKIVPGKLERFIFDNTTLDQEQCLLDQNFIKDERKSVADYISSYGDVDVSSFKRVSLG